MTCAKCVDKIIMDEVEYTEDEKIISEEAWRLIKGGKRCKKVLKDAEKCECNFNIDDKDNFNPLCDGCAEDRVNKMFPTLISE